MQISISGNRQGIDALFFNCGNQPIKKRRKMGLPNFAMQ
jgi:hypothetical protein